MEYGPGFSGKDLGLKMTATEPDVLSHMSEKTYTGIHALIDGKPKPVPCLIEHIYTDLCSKFNYVVFILTPTIIFTVVFRISYGWKAQKSVRMH